jgi:hypothetical protein
VPEPVACATAVVEEPEGGEQLFTRTLYRYAKGTCMPRTGLSSDTAVERIRAFTTWANQLATTHDRPHELIPPDPDGAVALRRFRRTIAWLVHRQPGGRIALAMQYGHAATAMSEPYAGRSPADMLDVPDREKGPGPGRDAHRGRQAHRRRRDGQRPGRRPLPRRGRRVLRPLRRDLPRQTQAARAGRPPLPPGPRGP